MSFAISHSESSQSSYKNGEASHSDGLMCVELVKFHEEGYDDAAASYSGHDCHSHDHREPQRTKQLTFMNRKYILVHTLFSDALKLALQKSGLATVPLSVTGSVVHLMYLIRNTFFRLLKQHVHALKLSD